MKEIRNGTTLFLMFIVIFAFSAQGSQQVLQLLCLNSPSSLKTDRVTPLRKNTFPPAHTPRTGIISHSNNPQSLRGSINDIEDEQNQYFPGSEIWITNQFEAFGSGSGIYAVEQEVYIFLYEQTSWTLQEMLDESNKTDLGGNYISNDSAECIYYVATTTTNGTPASEYASLSDDSTHGWINISFPIPDIATLNSMGIQSNDTVTIFQYYPALNVTESGIGIEHFIYHSDTFKLSSVATFTSNGFINDASGDEIFRAGENATTTLEAKSGPVGIENVNMSITGLHFQSNDSEITDPAALGIYYGLSSTITDASGGVELFVNTTYNTTFSTPEEQYYFNITANFSFTQFYTEDFTQFTNTTANFEVFNAPDIVEVLITAVNNDPIDPPNVNNTIVTVMVRVTNAYGGGLYWPQYIPINATLDVTEPWVNISFYTSADNGSGWGLTDASGVIQFIITAGYPIPYELKTPTLTVIADLHNSSAPGGNYPTGHPDSPHRFMENGAGLKTDTETRVISIDPDFWIGEVVRFSRTSSSIRPGESATLEFEVHSLYNSSELFRDVPVKISIDDPIPGVSLSFNVGRNTPYDIYGYYYTDSDGRIEVTVSTTYLLTPELVKNIAFNITADFENDSKVRWIGNTNAIDKGAADTLANFNKTWLSIIQSNHLAIDPRFNNCTITFSTTNETGNTVIRPGDDLTVYFIVRNEDATPLNNVPANVSFVDYTAMKSNGVSLTIHPGSGPLQRPGYYNTTGSGYIIVIISTEYGTTPKNLDIDLIATADFENDSQDKWYVGSKGVRSDFRSNSSYSEGTRGITVAPQYFTGYVYIPTDNPPNATLVQHNEVLQTEFRLRLTYSGGNVFPNIDGLNISIQINNTAPEDWNMEVTPASYQDSEDSSVIFYIKMNATGMTPEAMYILTVTADFGNIKNRIYNFTSPYPSTVPSGKLSGVWVNGTDVTGNYSFVTTIFEVKNIDLIRVWIPGGGVTDPFHPDAGFNSTAGLFEVYRVTSDITIEGTYKDNTQDPVQNKRIELYMNHSTGTRIPLDNNVWTNDQGAFSAVVNLSSTTPLEDGIKIYGEDPNPPTPREDHEAYDDIRVVSLIQFNNHNVNILNGTSVFVGESVSLTGTLHDNLNMRIDSSVSIFTNSFSELANNLRVVGWNGTHEIGVPTIASPNADGTYDLTYQIPYNYNEDTLSIRLNITNSGLIHYRVNYTQTPINIYWDFQIDNLEIYFPSNDTSTGLNNETSYLVSGLNNRDIIIRGTLADSSGRGLGAKWINTTWNDIISPSPHPVDDIPAGYFTLDYSFTGLENNTWIWEFHHLLDNGTELSKFYYITLDWWVFDIAAPLITILSPTENQTSPGFALLLRNDVTEIIVTVIDPSLTDVSDGLDNSSVEIQINGVNYTMNQITGQYSFFYNWDTSFLTEDDDISYNIIIFASDEADNWNSSGIAIVFDVVAPTGNLTVTKNNDGYLEVDSDGLVIISGTVQASNSNTGLNFGLNESSTRLFIVNSQTDNIEINESIAITDNSYSYDWAIILDPDDFERLSRDETFIGYKDWTINVTLHDLAGNIGYITLDVMLDKTPPTLEIDDNLPEEVDEEIMITVSFDDLETGIYMDTLTFEFRNSTEDVLYTVRYGEAGSNINETDSQATLIIDTSELPEGEYSIAVHIRDNTGNRQEAISEPFTIIHPTPPNPFTNILLLLASPVLAFGGGIGLAALYERVKGLRGG